MNEDKQQVPAAVVWDNTKKLVPVEFNWAHIMQACQQALTGDKEYVILPVEESQDFKPHKRRLLKDDRESPKGIIQRDSYARERYYPYAPARFNAEELAKYAAKRFNSMSSDDIERMAEEFMRGIDAGVE
jgi:hypothetical protein